MAEIAFEELAKPTNVAAEFFMESFPRLRSHGFAHPRFLIQFDQPEYESSKSRFPYRRAHFPRKVVFAKYVADETP